MQTIQQKKKTKALLVDVFHELELSTAAVDFRYRTWSQLVDELAEDLSVLKNILVQLTSGEFLSSYSLNPFLRFLVLLGIALSGNLPPKKRNVNKYFFNKTQNTYFSLNLTLKRHSAAGFCLREPKLKTENNGVPTLIYLRTGIFASGSPSPPNTQHVTLPRPITTIFSRFWCSCIINLSQTVLRRTTAT